MKKTFITAITLLSIFNASASKLILNYPNQVCDNQVCASLAVSKNYLAINVETNLLPLNEERFEAIVLINGQQAGKALMTRASRSGLHIAQVEIKTNSTGNVEIYFVNNKGQFISDYGRNFHFSL